MNYKYVIDVVVEVTFADLGLYIKKIDLNMNVSNSELEYLHENEIFCKTINVIEYLFGIRWIMTYNFLLLL